METDNNKLQELYLRIDNLKSDLIKVGLQIGFSHPTTVALSQKLDIIIFELHKEINRALIFDKTDYLLNKN